MLQIYINHFKEEFIVQETEKIDKTGKNKNKKINEPIKIYDYRYEDEQK